MEGKRKRHRDRWIYTNSAFKVLVGWGFFKLNNCKQQPAVVLFFTV